MYIFEQPVLPQEQLATPPQEEMPANDQGDLVPPQGAVPVDDNPESEEQFPPGNDLGGDGTGEEPQEPPELVPLKKYYLIQKLQDLKYQLSIFNITDENLENLIKFSDSISLNTLLLLSDKIISNLETLLKSKSKKDDKNV